MVIRKKAKGKKAKVMEVAGHLFAFYLLLLP
jgi:hypothetical protein